MDFVDLSLGLFVGIIIGSGGMFIYFKLSEDQSENKDKNDVFGEIKTLREKVETFKTEADTERGSINQILTDMRSAEQQVGEAAREIKRTLVTGGGQKQGAWGQLILEHILENKLQFTKGQEFEVQKSFNTYDRRLIQ